MWPPYRGHFYLHKYPQVAPSKFYAGDVVKYGIFEENSRKFWGEILLAVVCSFILPSVFLPYARTPSY